MLKKSLMALIAATVVSTAAIMPATAHHSTGAFYTDERVDVEGKVVEFLYVNPHGQLVIQDAAGAFWVGEMSSVLGLQRAGLTKAKLPIGSNIKINAQKSRDGSNRVFVRLIQKDGADVYKNEPEA
ncbi:DUF6152 family protein [Sinorhizobium meliloti]|uniref:Uncharacterized protein n=1 Tax=Rhizobium meliloti TaxID=382 RepID=A0A2J0YU60_RHIML|nr:DUF6152 family protein [Sinorhizobium meliloti]PJR09915.1 hypothetical protein CEJ86_30350 [Sinorhizobium meliloti]